MSLFSDHVGLFGSSEHHSMDFVEFHADSIILTTTTTTTIIIIIIIIIK